MATNEDTVASISRSADHPESHHTMADPEDLEDLENHLEHPMADLEKIRVGSACTYTSYTRENLPVSVCINLVDENKISLRSDHELDRGKETDGDEYSSSLRLDNELRRKRYLDHELRRKEIDGDEYSSSLRLDLDHELRRKETDGDEYSSSLRLDLDHELRRKQTDGDEYSSSLRLDHELYSYATQGKIDSFMDTIHRKLPADEAHDPNPLVRLLSRLSLHNKNTFLHIAASSGHAKLAAEIVHLHKPLLFKQNSEGDTALHITAKAGDLDTANTLLREARGIDNNDHDVFNLLILKNNEENTPLHEAVIHGHQSVAKCLIEGAHSGVLFCINKEGKTPLYLAAEEGFDEIVKLINKKAVEEKPEFLVKGKSPLHAAILGRRNNEILTIVSSMEKFFESSKDEKAVTPLHSAASIGYVEGVRFLLGSRISDCHQMDHGGNFPIHSASSKGHVKIVKELLRHCLNSKDLKNSKGENILHVAARCGEDNLVKYFLKKGEFRMLINQKDSSGNTPLHLATMYHHPKVVYRLAWDTRTNLKLLNGRGLTALDITKSPSETLASYHGELTWMVLKSVFAQRAQSLHVLQRKKLRSPQVADNGGGLTKLPNVESIRDRVNALLVVATLVATMAFAAGFTMPGGNNDSTPHEGMAILLTKAMFQAFVICNTIAMHTAILVAVCLIWAQLGDIYLVDTALHMALPLLGIALTMMSLAFTAGVYVVVINLHWLAYVVLILGVLFIVTVLVVFIPLSCKTTSRSRILCYITYFFFCVEEWASRSHNNDQKEDGSPLVARHCGRANLSSWNV